jgi:molecular chaperone Hsp33
MVQSAPSRDRWIKCISTQGNIRGVAIEAPRLVEEMSGMHKAQGIYAKGLGEATIAALLISSYCKPGERINLNVQGSGFYRQALVDAYPDGCVRGYIIERGEEEASAATDPSMGPWGSGLMSVLRTKETVGEKPYIGTVPLITGYLPKDLSFYWLQSEQIPSAVGIAVNLDDAGKITSAGGFLVQALPGASSEEVRTIERHINEIQSLAESLDEDADPMHLLTQIFQSTAFMVVEERELKFSCGCNWDRVNRALTLVGTQELRSMLQEDQHAIVRCDFCTKEYTVDADALQKLIDSSGPRRGGREGAGSA